ncbi:MAG: ABC transporter permease [Arthrobacter sp.]|nr:ABC transporter permease [Arthrobacter sp.]
MSAPATTTPSTLPSLVGRPVSFKTTIVLGLLAVLAFVFFGALGSDNSATLRLATDGDLFALPALVLPGRITGIVVGFLLLAIAGISFALARRGEKLPAWAVVVFGVLFVLGFLAWAVSGGDTPSISLTGLLKGALTLGIPLIFGTLSGVLGERSGVVNIAIEGQLLGGAFSAALMGTITGNAYLGLISAAVAGALVSMVLAVFAIKYLVNQIIVGVVLNVLVSGLTGFLFGQVMTANPEAFNQPPRLDRLPIPFLSQIPIIGPIFFQQTIIGYLLYVAVIGVWYALGHTRWGLRTRAVGEHPKAADTLGVKVNSLRFWNVTLGGAIAGIGGAYFTLEAVEMFTKDMSGGRGFIALAALILGRWNPIGAALAALLFGFADNLAVVLSIVGTPVPSQFLEMLPYIVTIFAVAGLVGKSRGPAASGEPYVKE